MLVPMIGATCLGIVMGWLVRYFLERFTQFNIRILTSVVSVLCGGAVIKMFPDPFQYAGWFYPVGLLVGVLAYPLIAHWERRFAPSPSRMHTGATNRRSRHAASGDSDRT